MLTIDPWKTKNGRQLNKEAIAQIGQVGVDAVAPGVAEGFYLLRFTGDVAGIAHHERGHEFGGLKPLGDRTDATQRKRKFSDSRMQRILCLSVAYAVSF